jgi:hypothetical protein
MSIELVPTGNPSVVVTEDNHTVELQLPLSAIIEVGDSGIQPPAKQ